MKNIDAKKIHEGFTVIDIRDNSDFLKGHIPNAINIPEFELLNNPYKYLNKNNTYYICCAFGNRSKKTCELLELLGFDVINVFGGYDSFKK